ncbi:ribokinase [Evansella halocellulosilytica]|uniref:ribokinase n=1 Tax=Evansella halocellulosilytica TaxID=2011013 RepID=UPI0015C6B1B0|nr:ribokinase [Evansella halocellulosilytica]
MSKKITVVGSINADVVATTGKYPIRGETKFGKTVNTFPGGKGANQATACHRLGKETFLVGVVGDDMFGSQILSDIQKSGLDTKYIKMTKEASTGVAMIMIDETAENTMLVIKGANDTMKPEDLRQVEQAMKESEILLLQMEVPEDVVIQAMIKAKSMNKLTVLDPAPADGITFRALNYCDVIIPNKQETKFLTGVDVHNTESARRAARHLDDLGVKNIILKMGDKGCFVYKEGREEVIPAIKVDPVDTVGAGDSFSAAVACALADGVDLFQAAEFAVIVSGLAVTQIGAQSGLPTLDDVLEYAKEHDIHHYLLNYQ